MNQLGGTYTCSRDRHLFGPGPKRILALDGGGVRGAITVAFLERIEAILLENQEKSTEKLTTGEIANTHADKNGTGGVSLGNMFDLIGGTSTGAIVAGALALGYRTADLKNFYLDRAKRIFTSSYIRIPGFRARYDAAALQEEIEEIVKDRRLSTTDLITGLCVITKRMDTGSPWIVANNPLAPYWETKPADPKTGEKGHIGNKYFKLANLVRASTAAPYYFDSEEIQIVENEKSGLFIDGGVTPHNNPSLMLFLMAVLKPYKLCWLLGPSNLTVVSIGTGSYRDKVLQEDVGGVLPPVKLAFHALLSLMNDTQTFVLAQMQWLGQSLIPWRINSEWGALSDNALPGGPFFQFLRYDVQLEADWLYENLGMRVKEADVLRMRSTDDPAIIHDIYGIATVAAKKQVLAGHWL